MVEQRSTAEHRPDPGSDSPPRVMSIMWQTNLALLPGIVVLVYFFGALYLQNLVIAVLASLGMEALAAVSYTHPDAADE